MKPLSAVKYYRNNLLRSLPIVVAITITVCLLYSLCMIGGAIITAAQVFFTNPMEYFSLVYLNSEAEAKQEVQTNLANYQYIEQVFPATWRSLQVRIVMGGTVSSRVLFMNQKNIKLTINQLDLQLKQGRLPNKKREVTLHWRVAADKGLAVGDKLEAEGFENYELVGILKGPCVTSLGYIEDRENYNLVVIPDKNKVSLVNDFLQTLLPDSFSQYSIDKARSHVQKVENKLVGFLIILETIIVVVLAITIGNITYIYYYQRRREFGILTAIGYTVKDIAKKIIAEIAVINFTSFTLGVGLAMIIGYLLNNVVFIPLGEKLYLWNPNFLLITLIVPLVVLVASLISVIKLLVGLDKIKIIERGD